MHFTQNSIAGVWINSPLRHSDSRGTFEEQFKSSAILKALGRDFRVSQMNQSISRRGVLRGIHWTDGPVGQAKYLSCVNGAIWDVFVDLRADSESFGQWGAEVISSDNGKSVLISEGIGHAFLSLEDHTVVNYLCTSEFDPSADRTINPLDPDLAIPFIEVAGEYGITELVLSDKDRTGSPFASISN